VSDKRPIAPLTLTRFPLIKKKSRAFEKIFASLSCCDFRVSEIGGKKNFAAAKNLLASAGRSSYNPFSPSKDESEIGLSPRTPDTTLWPIRIRILL
jgi:hypothetical protein